MRRLVLAIATPPMISNLELFDYTMPLAKIQEKYPPRRPVCFYSRDFQKLGKANLLPLFPGCDMIQTIEDNKDKVICCPEQIAYYKSWISKEELQERADLLKKNSYGQYLQKVIDETK